MPNLIPIEFHSLSPPRMHDIQGKILVLFVFLVFFLCLMFLAFDTWIVRCQKLTNRPCLLVITIDVIFDMTLDYVSIQNDCLGNDKHAICHHSIGAAQITQSRGLLVAATIWPNDGKDGYKSQALAIHFSHQVAGHFESESELRAFGQEGRKERKKGEEGRRERRREGRWEHIPCQGKLAKGFGQGLEHTLAPPLFYFLISISTSS